MALIIQLYSYMRLEATLACHIFGHASCLPLSATRHPAGRHLYSVARPIPTWPKGEPLEPLAPPLTCNGN